jgi:hypothetical protein
VYAQCNLRWIFLSLGKKKFSHEVFETICLCHLQVCVISYEYAQHQHKNSKFAKVPYTCWACTKKLMCALSLRIRNWYVHWAYESGTDAHAQPAHQKLNVAYSLTNVPKFRSLRYCSQKGMLKKGFKIYLWTEFGKSTLLNKNIFKNSFWKHRPSTMFW